METINKYQLVKWLNEQIEGERQYYKDLDENESSELIKTEQRYYTLKWVLDYVKNISK